MNKSTRTFISYACAVLAISVAAQAQSTTQNWGTQSAAGGASVLIASAINSANASVGGSSTGYQTVAGVVGTNGNGEAAVTIPLRAGTLQNLCVGMVTAQNAGGSLVFTVRTSTNGSSFTSSSIVATVPASGSNQKYCDNTHTLAIAGGTFVDIQVVNNAGGASGIWYYTYLELQ